MIDKIIEQQETIKGMQENEESAIKIMKMYEDYKLRVDKAIEKIESYRNILWTEYDEELLKILKGDNKE